MVYRRMRRIAAPVFFLLLRISYADQIVLQNGDRITGSVIKKDEKSLTFKSDIFGKITLPWEKVQSLTAEKPVFIVLPGKEPVLATIEPKQDHVEIASIDSTQFCELSDLLAIRNNDEQTSYERLLKPSWAQLWAGTATLGWAGARGNARALTLNAAFNAARISKTDKTDVQMRCDSIFRPSR